MEAISTFPIKSLPLNTIWRGPWYDYWQYPSFQIPDKKSWLPLSVCHNQTLSTHHSWGFSSLISYLLHKRIITGSVDVSLNICFKRMYLMNVLFFKKKKSKFWLQSNLRIFAGVKPKPTHPKQNGIPENESLPKTKNRLGPVFLKLDRFYQYHIITLIASYNAC